MGEADAGFVEEADPARTARSSPSSLNAKTKSHHTGRRIWTVIAAASLTFALLLTSVVLLIPSDKPIPSVNTTGKNDTDEQGSVLLPNETDPPIIIPPSGDSIGVGSYAPVVEQLKLYYDQEFEFFPEADDVLPPGTISPDLEASPPMSAPPSDDTPEYEEVTDNQVEGVIEDDFIKRSDKHIFYMRDNRLDVYSIKGIHSDRVGSYSIEGTYTTRPTFFLSKDCRTAIVIISEKRIPPNGKNLWTHVQYTRLLLLDVSDPASIQSIGEVRVDGNYNASRLIDNRLLLVTAYSVQPENCINYEDPSTYIPGIDEGDGLTCIPPDCIGTPDTDITSNTFTVLTMLSADDLSLISAAAMLSYSSDVYVNNDRLYLSRTFTEPNNKFTVKTEIMGLSHTESKFAHLGAVTVEGAVLNQYSMDEYNGILRVVTTTGRGLTSNPYNASLYCVDLTGDAWRTIASVEKFAPDGEDVRSVRFDGDYAYVCTAVKVINTDPVYFFDLSDMSNITYTDTGTIPGFSHSLVNVGGGYLLGIGQDTSSDTLKLELYREEGDKVISVDTFRQNCYAYSNDYKSYYIDREAGYIGFSYVTQIIPAENFGTYKATYTITYVLCSFKDGAITTLLQTDMETQADRAYSLLISQNRSVVIDDCFYMFSLSDDFAVVKIP